MVMIIYIKQRRKSTWSLTHEKVIQHWGWAEKNVAYKIARNLFVIYSRFMHIRLHKNIMLL